MDLVTIKTFSYPYEMAVVRSLLESEGIPTLVMNEVISQLNPFYSNAGGGVKLQVDRRDAPRALQIMLEKGFIEKEPDATFEGISTNIRPDKRRDALLRYALFAVFLLVLLILLLYSTR